jgi:hypothetical protein
MTWDNRKPWNEFILYDVPGSSRYRLITHRDGKDVMSTGLGFVDFTRILPVTQEETQLALSLTPLPKNYTRFGILGVVPFLFPQKAHPLRLKDTTNEISWFFGLEWVRNSSAWDAALFTFDHLGAFPITLSFTLVIPAFFLARMADQPQASVQASVKAWAPILNEVYIELLILIMALYVAWWDGPSNAAEELRGKSEDEALAPHEMGMLQSQLDTFVQIFGKEPLEKLRAVERLEPALFRLLDQASKNLWSSTLRLDTQQVHLLKCHFGLQGLLPLALWDAQSPIAQAIANDPPQSLAALYEAWLVHRAVF